MAGNKNSGRRSPNTIYMAVTDDEYELPLAVADSVRELSELRRANYGSLQSYMSRPLVGGGTCKYGERYVKVVV